MLQRFLAVLGLDTRRRRWRLLGILTLGLGLFVAAVVLRDWVRGAVIENVVQRRVCRIEPRLGMQTWPLHIDSAADGCIALSLEFPGVSPDASQFRELRFNLTIKDGQKTLMKVDSVGQACNWHEPWKGVLLDTGRVGGEMNVSKDSDSLYVEFEWVEIPASPAKAVLWYSYPTRALAFE